MPKESCCVGGESQTLGGPKGESHCLRGEFSGEMEDVLPQGEGIDDLWCVFIRGWT